MEFETLEVLTNEELTAKINELTKMWRFYKMTGNQQAMNQLRQYIDIAYTILDERAIIKFHKDFDEPDGVIIDSEKKRVKKEEAPTKVVGRKPTL